jgi:hypothetical protein
VKPLNSTKPVNSNMSLGTGFAFPYDNVPLNSTYLQITLLFLRSQGYVLFAGFTVLGNMCKSCFTKRLTWCNAKVTKVCLDFISPCGCTAIVCCPSSSNSLLSYALRLSSAICRHNNTSDILRNKVHVKNPIHSNPPLLPPTHTQSEQNTC